MSAGPSFRKAVDADAPAVRGLTRAAYAKWVAVIGREPMPMTADHDDAIKHHHVELAEIGGELAGLVELIPHDEWLLIENLAVAPTFQQRGIGNALLARTEALAAQAGHRRVRLYTNALFAENIGFYERRGYRTIAAEPFRGGALVHMEKMLAAPAKA